MLKIKLALFGKKHETHYRIVVAEEHSKLNGDMLTVLGHYHPLSKTLDVDKKAVEDWISRGAQPTTRIRRLLKL